MICPMRVEVIGVYPVRAPEPCHLIELRFGDVAEPIRFEEITQENRRQLRSNWQVPYDERWLDAKGETEIETPEGDTARTAFFFHHLDFRAPLLTPAGLVKLPLPHELPTRLQFIEYIPPC
jgi:hypothetical protein